VETTPFSEPCRDGINICFLKRGGGGDGSGGERGGKKGTWVLHHGRQTNPHPKHLCTGAMGGSVKRHSFLCCLCGFVSHRSNCGNPNFTPRAPSPPCASTKSIAWGTPLRVAVVGGRAWGGGSGQERREGGSFVSSLRDISVAIVCHCVFAKIPMPSGENKKFNIA